MTFVILGTTALVWVLVQGAGFSDRLFASVCNYGLVPAELTGLRPVGFAVGGCAVDDNAINWLTPVFTIFLHGSWGHIVGNMWFFWVFGNNIEDAMGPGRFAVFYLLCGMLAAAAHVASAPSSPVPTVGASGAVSGIMGAYLVLHPRARVNILIFFVVFVRTIPVPAWFALVWWFAVQLISALPALQPADEFAGGVAFAAHIGGFLAGVALVKLFARSDYLSQQRLLHNQRYPQRAW